MITKTFKLTIATDTEEQMRKEGEHLSMVYGAEEIEEDKTGKWECVVYDANINIMNWHCSECRNIVIFTAKSHIKPYYKYCPWCGIKMEVEE